jgi:antirestriction protein ArdC
MDNRVEKIKEQLVLQIIKLIEDEQLFWERVWAGQYNYLTNHTYSGYNAMILSMHYYFCGYDDPRWMTKYQMFKNYLEFKNPEDEKTGGVDIFFYRTIDDNTQKTFNPFSKSFKSLLLKEQIEYKRKHVHFDCYVPYTVYNCSLIDGIKPYVKPPEDVNAKNDYLEAIIQNSFVNIQYDGMDKAYYLPSSDSMHLPERRSFKSRQFFYGVTMHEMAHATGHSSRLNRKTNSHIFSEERAYEELVAEFSSILMQLEYGCTLSDEHINNHAAYLQSWKKGVRDDQNVVSLALTDANKVIVYIKKQYEQNNKFNH